MKLRDKLAQVVSLMRIFAARVFAIFKRVALHRHPQIGIFHCFTLSLGITSAFPLNELLATYRVEAHRLLIIG